MEDRNRDSYVSQFYSCQISCWLLYFILFFTVGLNMGTWTGVTYEGMSCIVCRWVWRRLRTKKRKLEGGSKTPWQRPCPKVPWHVLATWSHGMAPLFRALRVLCHRFEPFSMSSNAVHFLWVLDVQQRPSQVTFLTWPLLSQSHDLWSQLTRFRYGLG